MSEGVENVTEDVPPALLLDLDLSQHDLDTAAAPQLQSALNVDEQERILQLALQELNDADCEPTSENQTPVDPSVQTPTVPETRKGEEKSDIEHCEPTFDEVAPCVSSGANNCPSTLPGARPPCLPAEPEDSVYYDTTDTIDSRPTIQPVNTETRKDTIKKDTRLSSFDGLEDTDLASTTQSQDATMGNQQGKGASDTTPDAEKASCCELTKKRQKEKIINLPKTEESYPSLDAEILNPTRRDSFELFEPEELETFEIIEGDEVKVASQGPAPSVSKKPDTGIVSVPEGERLVSPAQKDVIQRKSDKSSLQTAAPTSTGGEKTMSPRDEATLSDRCSSSEGYITPDSEIPLSADAPKTERAVKEPKDEVKTQPKEVAAPSTETRRKSQIFGKDYVPQSADLISDIEAFKKATKLTRSSKQEGDPVSTVKDTTALQTGKEMDSRSKSPGTTNKSQAPSKESNLSEASDSNFKEENLSFAQPDKENKVKTTEAKKSLSEKSPFEREAVMLSDLSTETAFESTNSLSTECGQFKVTFEPYPFLTRAEVSTETIRRAVLVRPRDTPPAVQENKYTSGGGDVMAEKLIVSPAVVETSPAVQMKQPVQRKLEDVGKSTSLEVPCDNEASSDRSADDDVTPIPSRSETVPPPTPSAMDAFAEEDEDEEEDDHVQEARKSIEIVEFGDTICKRLSLLLDETIDSEDVFDDCTEEDACARECLPVKDVGKSTESGCCSYPAIISEDTIPHKKRKRQDCDEREINQDIDGTHSCIESTPSIVGISTAKSCENANGCESTPTDGSTKTVRDAKASQVSGLPQDSTGRPKPNALQSSENKSIDGSLFEFRVAESESSEKALIKVEADTVDQKQQSNEKQIEKQELKKGRVQYVRKLEQSDKMTMCSSEEELNTLTQDIEVMYQNLAIEQQILRDAKNKRKDSQKGKESPLREETTKCIDSEQDTTQEHLDRSLSLHGHEQEHSLLCNPVEDISDMTPTSEVFPALEALPELAKADEETAVQYHTSGRQSATWTESDLDISEHRDDGSTEGMYADDEDEETMEILFTKTYTEPIEGAEVFLSCTVVNTAFKEKAPEQAWLTEEAMEILEGNAADVMSTAFMKAKMEMQDIQVCLRSLREQMKTLNDDVDNVSLPDLDSLDPGRYDRKAVTD